MTDSPHTPVERTADVGAQRVAHVYAEALLNAAGATGNAATVLDELEALVREVFRADRQMEEFFVSGAMGRDRKSAVIRAVFESRSSEVFTNFLLVLNQHDRLNLLRPILLAGREIDNDRTKRIRVQVTSAVPLSEEQRERLRQGLRESFHLEPLLENRLDPDLLGGMVVRVGDWLADASVRTRLESIRNQLIESSSYEIQSRRDRFRTTNGD